MTIYAFLITMALFFILGYEFHKEQADKKSRRRYEEWYAQFEEDSARYSGKRVKTDVDTHLEGFDEDENKRINEIKDELGGTILDYRSN